MFQYLKRSRLDSHFIDVEVRIYDLLKDLDVDRELQCLLSTLCVRQIKEYKDYKSSIECDTLIAICLTQYKAVILSKTNSKFKTDSRVDMYQCIRILESLMPDLVLTVRTISSMSDNKLINKVLSDIELKTNCFHLKLLSEISNSILCSSCWWKLSLEERFEYINRNDIFLVFSGYIKALIDTYQIPFMVSRLDTLNQLYQELINSNAPTFVGRIESDNIDDQPSCFKVGYSTCVNILKGNLSEKDLIDFIKDHAL